MLRKLVPIKEAAQALGVSTQTLRRWEREGKLLPDGRTAGGRRRYDLARLQPEKFRAAAQSSRRTVAYARVSFAICEAKQVEIVILNQGEDSTF
ncbi:MAG: MerR family DNA-binding transcriptional regulator, partial [Comamonas sp.]|nr:MerR family DNA-binding transcriptional regulator [Comamonas sp.]